MAEPVRCACVTCRGTVDRDKAVARNGKLYCSRTCAYDCTATTCVCVHAICCGTQA